MNPFIKRMIVPGAFAVVAAIVAGYQAGGAAARAGQPTSLVTVNLSAVLEKLQQRADAAAALQQMSDRLKAESEKREGDLRKQDSDLKAMADGPEKRDLEDKIRLGLLNFRAWSNVSTNKLDVEAALRYQDLYQSVKDEAARIAATGGYDVVLVDDSQGMLSFESDSQVSRQAQILQQISSRRLLYVNVPAIDITDELIDRMNNAYRAAGPKAAPK